MEVKRAQTGKERETPWSDQHSSRDRVFTGIGGYLWGALCLLSKEVAYPGNLGC